MTTHILKSWPQFFQAIYDRTRTHDLRRNDRDFIIGDEVELREYLPEEDRYTGRIIYASISSITSDDIPCAVSAEGLTKGFCILSLAFDRCHSPDMQEPKVRTYAILRTVSWEEDQEEK